MRQLPAKTFILLWAFVAPLCLYATNHPPSVSSAQASTIILPIEVIGPDGYTAGLRFTLDEAAGIDALYLKAHRLAYRDASTNPGRGAKGSVQLNDGPWVDLDNSTVNCYDHEAAYGCLSGAYHTVRLTVPIEGAVGGENTLRFRFNGTDNFTSGYRILALNLLRGGQEVLPASAFAQDNPTRWAPPRDNATDIAQGKQLWETASLQDFPGGPTIQATCSGCHTHDGRDLEYYSFSNWSIQERAKFHGLKPTEAEQIASYIRSLSSAKNVPRAGRPWNPPYQPGPRLDGRPVEEWAAGAGLDWVLEEDQDMLPYLFPEGTSARAVAEVADNRGTLNVREMPIALQLPDWQAWLPEEHPVDVWGEAFRQTEPYRIYSDTRDRLGGGGAQAMRDDPGLVEAQELIRTLDPLRQSVSRFVGVGGAQPCRNSNVHTSEGFALLGRPTSPPASGKWDDAEVCERPLRAISHWNAIKHWEVMHEFDLEEATADVYPYGEVRGWVGSHRQVFDLAPHRIGNDSYTFTHLGRGQGSYFNTAWYQLQVTLNAGNRNPQNHRPPDWKYQMNHLYHAADDNDHPQPLRYVQTLIKMQQNLDMRPPQGAPKPADYFPYQEDRGPTANGWWLTHVTPWRFVSVGGSFFGNDERRFAIWDEVEAAASGLKNNVQNALLAQWLEKTETYEPDEWPRGEGQNNVNPADYVPTAYPGKGLISSSGVHADGIYRTIPRMHQAGIRPDLIERLRQWGKSLWPKGDWDALKVEPPEASPRIVLEAEDFVERDARSDPQGDSWRVATRQADFREGGYVVTSDLGQCVNGGWTAGAQLHYSFKVKQPATYHLWVRRYAPTTGSNSAYFAVDGQPLSTVDNKGSFSRWYWVKLESPSLSPGEHTLVMARREDGYLVDQFLLTMSNEDPNQADARQTVASARSSSQAPSSVSALQLYPNPVVDGQLQLTLPTDATFNEVIVATVQGQRLMQQPVNEARSMTVDVRMLPRGVYVVEARGPQRVVTEKVLVE